MREPSHKRAQTYDEAQRHGCPSTSSVFWSTSFGNDENFVVNIIIIRINIIYMTKVWSSDIGFVVSSSRL